MIEKIESVREIADNTFRVTFLISDSLFDFKAGQYITVTLPQLKDMETREQFRDFSIASSPNKLPKLSIVFRKSESIFKKTLLGMAEGDQVLIEGPRGVFTLPDTTERPIVFVAGGVGVAPFMSIMEFVTKNRLPYRITLAYFNNNLEQSAYLPELESIAKQNQFIKVIKKLGPAEEKDITPFCNQKPLWYIAGPSGMVRATRDILTKFGILEADINTEEFTGY